MPGAVRPAALASAREDRVEHRLGEPAGERVLLAHVVAADQRQVADLRTPRRDRTSAAVAGFRAPPAASAISAPFQPNAPSATIARTLREQPPARAPGTAAQRSRSSVAGLLSGGAQRTAAVTQASVQRQPVVDRDRLRLIREPGAEHRRVEPVARPIAGEHAARAVGAVGRGGQPDDSDARAGSPKPGTGARPVVLAAISLRRIGGDGLAPLDQPRAGASSRRSLR